MDSKISFFHYLQHLVLWYLRLYFERWFFFENHLSFDINHFSNLMPFPLEQQLHSVLFDWLMFWIHTKKRGAYSVTRFHAIKLSHCPTSRNEQRRKPHAQCKYIEALLTTNYGIVRSQWGLYIIHLMSVLCCFVLDLSLNLRDSYSVKTKAYKNAFYHM